MGEDNAVSPNTPQNIVLTPQGFLAVRVFFHRQPIGKQDAHIGLAVQFFEIGVNGILTLKGTQIRTDENGLAALPDKVPLGVYVCQIERQDKTLVPTVPAKEKPYVLVLPIGVGPFDTGGDREFLDP